MKRVTINYGEGRLAIKETESPEEWIALGQSVNRWGEEGTYTIEIEDITAQVEQEKVNAEALAYLASTDWMVIREMDQGTACPAEVKQARAEARARIVK